MIVVATEIVSKEAFAFVGFFLSCIVLLPGALMKGVVRKGFVSFQLTKSSQAQARQGDSQTNKMTWLYFIEIKYLSHHYDDNPIVRFLLQNGDTS